ncbi:GL17484 [Drosophila persimilis]|uniref:Uncharacterized protein n=2 Tax=pseudoobscura subgroup TaxID=32358 RepID=A0A6I8UW26_DROPS|nr:uncharacterized protein LOC4805290 [Drosophila pseudoobscura]XP_002018025.1 uncharacterized protein LOC6592975 [Drosophila persimilis]EDW35864.1 GL17484 [Drosophila persimilis]
MEYHRPADAQTMLLIMIVIIGCSTTAHGQSYLIALENVLNESPQPQHQPPYNLTTANSTTDVDPFANSTRIIVYKNTVVEPSNELSQTAMDVITIVWYVATFLALAAFFMLMACSDRRCRDMRRHHSGAGAQSEGVRAPPTPSPSYSEFAPPSYDTVIKMQHAAKTSVFVIPFNKASDPGGNPAPTSQPPPVTCNIYTVHELQKSGN